MGEGNNPEAGETTLAAATAAIITARWTAHARPSVPSVNGANGHDVAVNGHDGHHNGSGGIGAGGNGVNGHGNGHGPAGFGEPWAPPPAVGFDSGLPPVSPAPPVSAAPYVHGQGPGVVVSSSPFFVPPQADPTPEVFPAPTTAAPGNMAPGNMAPGNMAPGASSAPFESWPINGREPVPGRDGPREEIRTQVPPGFERKNFGPTDEPVDPRKPAAGVWGLAPSRTDEPRGPEPVPPPLLGVLPTPMASNPLPPTLAPPEPPAWTDSWVDFPREIPGFAEPATTMVGAGAVGTLPRRVPRAPDMDFPLELPLGETSGDPPTQRQELSRIATFLRDEDETPVAPRPDGVDLEAVLGAVRQVREVRDAQLRWNAQAGHTLRIEFAEGVDESEVTRSVVRLLRATLGLEAQPSVEEPTLDSPYRGRVSVPGRDAVRSPQVAVARPLPQPFGVQVPRLVVEHVTVTRLGAEASVEVRLRLPRTGAASVGEVRGPGVDAYLSRLAATAAATAADKALAGRGKVFIEHVSVVPYGVVEVALVVLLLTYDGVTEQLSGSAIVGDDPHQAVVRATMAALNRRLESLLS